MILLIRCDSMIDYVHNEQLPIFETMNLSNFINFVWQSLIVHLGAVQNVEHLMMDLLHDSLVLMSKMSQFCILSVN